MFYIIVLFFLQDPKGREADEQTNNTTTRSPWRHVLPEQTQQNKGHLVKLCLD